jgi:hypothetical protein
MKLFTVYLVRLLAIGSFAAVAACASHVEYPESWGSATSAPTAEGCPNLEGLYNNHPSEAFPVKVDEAPDLTDVFLRMANGPAPRRYGQTWSVPSHAVAVSITQSPEELFVTFIDAIDERTIQRFRRMKITRLEERYDDLFSCGTVDGEPRLSFPFTPASHQTAVAQGIYMGGSDTFIFLRKAVDGSLIVQLRTESIGLSIFLIGTHFTFDSLWLRFPPFVPCR